MTAKSEFKDRKRSLVPAENFQLSRTVICSALGHSQITIEIIANSDQATKHSVSAVPRHADSLVLPALLADTTVDIGGVSAVLQLIRAGSHQSRLTPSISEPRSPHPER
jgi:hypothetical protein